MASLEERLQALEDEKEIRRTLTQYSHAIDQRDTQEPSVLSDCFTEDGVWWASVEGPWAGAGGARHTGRQEIEAWFLAMRAAGSATPGPQAKGKHYLVSPDISVQGDQATAESYHLGVNAHEFGPEINSMGRYLDGRWRIKERHLAKEGANLTGQTRIIGARS
jgi:ketosteroid isomerase-like protein